MIKSIAWAAIFTFVIAVDARAQAATDNLHTLSEDAWALQFGVSSLSLTSFTGSTISAKHHFTDSRALRYGLSLRGSYRDDERREIYNVDLRFNALYTVYPTVVRDPDAQLHLFYGFGPELGVASQGVQDAGSDHDRTLFRFGVAGVIGAEWFVMSRISLTADYLSSVTVGLGDDLTEFVANPIGGRLGVSAYF